MVFKNSNFFININIFCLCFTLKYVLATDSTYRSACSSQNDRGISEQDKIYIKKIRCFDNKLQVYIINIQNIIQDSLGYRSLSSDFFTNNLGSESNFENISDETFQSDTEGNDWFKPQKTVLN